MAARIRHGVAGLLILVGATALHAQNSDLFQPPPREALQRIGRAEKALKENSFNEAVEYLGALLANEDAENTEGEGQDYFLEAAENTENKPFTRTASLRSEAQRLIASHPQVLEAYELRFGAEARTKMDQAIEAGSNEKLNDVVRRFFYTQAGHQAAMLLAHQQLEQGRPLSAAIGLDRVLNSPLGAKFGAELPLSAAVCWTYANYPDRAKAALLQLKRYAKQGRVTLDGQNVTLFEADDQALKWLETTVGAKRPIQSTPTMNWAMAGGDVQRNADSTGGVPILTLRWRNPTANDYTDQQTVEQLSGQYRKQGAPILPALQPLAVGDMIVMRTPRTLLGIDFQTGKRVWEYPIDPRVEKPTVTPTPMIVGRAGMSTPDVRLFELSQRVWSDNPYGNLSSSGDHIYVLDALEAATMMRNTGMMFFGGVRNRQVEPGTFNKLVALSLKRQGALVWSVGGKDSEDARLAETFFLGPPLPLKDVLYVLGEKNGEIRLLALDPANRGQLLWHQQIAHKESMPIRFDVVRRLAGAMPSFGDGVIVCPTAAGAVVAVDAASRSLLWAFQYQPQAPGNPNQFFGGFVQPNMNQVRPGNGWADNTARIADGRVIVTPIENDRIYCLDLLTGKSLWKDAASEGLPRGDMLYVATIHEGKAVVVAKNSIVALSLADGKTLWTQSLNNDMPSGRGFFSDGHYFLPTTGSELLRIDVAKGQIVQRSKTSLPLGNLICYRGQVVSQGADWITSFYQMDPLRSQVAERLQKNPNDIWALTRQGELHLHDGKRAEALVALRKAYQLSGKGDDTDEIQTLLVSTLLATIKDDFKALAEIGNEVEDLIEQPDQRLEYRRLLALGYQAKGELLKAFDAFLKLGETALVETHEIDPSRALMERLDPYHFVRRDRWIHARLAEMFASATPEQKTQLEDRIAKRFDAVLQKGDPAELRRTINLFGFAPQADRARFVLASKLRETRNFLEAEMLYGRLARSANPSLAATAVLETARLLEKAEKPEQAWQQYRLLAERFGDVVVEANKTGKQLFAEVTAPATVIWPTGRIEQGDRTAPPTGGAINGVYPVALREVRGPFPAGWSVAYQQNVAFVIRDANGNDVTTVRVSENEGGRFVNAMQVQSFAMGHGKANGHLMLLAIGGNLVAVDTLGRSDGSALWRQDLLTVVPGQNNNPVQITAKALTHPWGGERMVGVERDRPIGMFSSVSDTGVCFQRLRELLCVDPLSGRTIWSRENLEVGSEVFGDDEYVFVVAPNSDRATVVSLLDGRTLGNRLVYKMENRWATHGRRVLAWEDFGQRLTLKLFDAFSGDTIWSEDVPKGTKATLVEHDEVALLLPDGAFRVRSLEDNRVRLNLSVPDEKPVAIYVWRSDDQYLLFTTETARNVAAMGVNTYNFQPIFNSFQSPEIEGRIYAASRATGQMVWPSPARISQYSLPLDQPRNLPVLALARRTTQGQQQTTVICLDKRDGRLVFTSDRLPQLYGLKVHAPAGQKSVHLTMMPGRSYALNFTDAPVPPEPPAMLGKK